VLNANVNNINQGATFLWSTSQTTPTIRPTRSGTYSVTVTIGNCTVTDEVTITVLPAIITNIPRTVVTLCTEDAPIEPVTLDAGPGQNFTYLWPHSGERTQTVEVSQTGIYIVRISDGSGCTKQDTINVIPRCDARVFVPTAFSPDERGPAANERLQISGKYLVDSKLIIFNRWGEVVFTAEDILDPANFWDGTYLGRPAPIGSYAWKITYKSRDNPNAEPVEIRGGVMLLR
jgi:gliding motility-associated-like protein